MHARALTYSIPFAPRAVVMESTNIRWNDEQTRWMLEHAARLLGVAAPPPHTEEFEWATTELSDSSAMTLYMAARRLADKGRLEEALEVLGDACRAQRCARATVREIRAARALLT